MFFKFCQTPNVFSKILFKLKVLSKITVKQNFNRNTAFLHHREVCLGLVPSSHISTILEWAWFGLLCYFLSQAHYTKPSNFQGNEKKKR